uniref:Uncharacterized protein n=1 Tax=Arundo donax TaxID=35708 RepID=A0A0A9C622_ARUDO
MSMHVERDFFLVCVPFLCIDGLQNAGLAMYQQPTVVWTKVSASVLGPK